MKYYVHTKHSPLQNPYFSFYPKQHPLYSSMQSEANPPHQRKKSPAPLNRVIYTRFNKALIENKLSQIMHQRTSPQTPYDHNESHELFKKTRNVLSRQEEQNERNKSLGRIKSDKERFHSTQDEILKSARALERPKTQHLRKEPYEELRLKNLSKINRAVKIIIHQKERELSDQEEMLNTSTLNIHKTTKELFGNQTYIRSIGSIESEQKEGSEEEDDHSRNVKRMKALQEKLQKRQTFLTESAINNDTLEAKQHNNQENEAKLGSEEAEEPSFSGAELMRMQRRFHSYKRKQVEKEDIPRFLSLIREINKASKGINSGFEEIDQIGKLIKETKTNLSKHIETVHAAKRGLESISQNKQRRNDRKLLQPYRKAPTAGHTSPFSGIRKINNVDLDTNFVSSKTFKKPTRTVTDNRVGRMNSFIDASHLLNKKKDTTSSVKPCRFVNKRSPEDKIMNKLESINKVLLENTRSFTYQVRNIYNH